MCSIPQINPHPLKAQLLKKLRLWQIRKMIGGSPDEGSLSRYLNGIRPMPAEVEEKLQGLARSMAE